MARFLDAGWHGCHHVRPDLAKSVEALMCLLCDIDEGDEKIRKSYQLGHFIKKYPNIHGKYEIMKNYMFGKWTREYLTKYPKIIARHTEGFVWDVDALFADCDAQIAASGGDGEKAWKALNEEWSKEIHTWAVKHKVDKPAPQPEEKARPEIIDPLPSDATTEH